MNPSQQRSLAEKLSAEAQAKEEDRLESREFYELCYAYRHSLMGADGFEAIKDFIRSNFTQKDTP